MYFTEKLAQLGSAQSEQPAYQRQYALRPRSGARPTVQRRRAGRRARPNSQTRPMKLVSARAPRPAQPKVREGPNEKIVSFTQNDPWHYSLVSASLPLTPLTNQIHIKSLLALYSEQGRRHPTILWPILGSPLVRWCVGVYPSVRAQ